MTAPDLFGYRFDTPPRAEIHSVLLWAPIDVDFNRFHPKEGRALCKRMGYRGDRPKFFFKQCLTRWYERFTALRDRIIAEGSDAASAAGIEHPWIGLFSMAETRKRIEEIQAYQHQHHIPDGYMAHPLVSDIATLEIWYDR